MKASGGWGKKNKLTNYILFENICICTFEGKGLIENAKITEMKLLKINKRKENKSFMPIVGSWELKNMWIKVPV